MPNNQTIQSLERGLDILERVASAREGIGVRALADLLKLKTPTAHNLIRTLTLRGYLERATQPVRYRLGPAFGEIARLAASPFESAAAEHELLSLQTAHSEGVFTLSQASRHAAMVVLRVSPDAPGVIQRPVAQTLSPYGSATALLFQALWTEDERTAFRERHPFWESAAPALWKTPEALDAFLRKVRRTGVAVTHFRGEAIIKLAAPVYGPNGSLTAALGVALPARIVTAAYRTRMIDELKKSAERLTPETPAC